MQIKTKISSLLMTSFGRHSLALLLCFLFTLKLFPQINQNLPRPQINRIVEKLRKENQVHFGYPVGFAGEPETKNKYYKLYLKLKDKATLEELVFLTSDTSESIVVYSFDILLNRQYQDLKNVFLRHFNDTTFFWTASGCTGTLNRINWFMLKRLKPNQKDVGKNYLTKQEYDFYCSKLHKRDNLFSCN